jgi:hypothetical protein
MSTTSLHSEPFSRDGNLAADGAQRLLGQPALSPLELVIRETIQNSWDASLETVGTPVYSIRIRRLDAMQMDTMRSFFSQLPPMEAAEPIAAQIGRFLSSDGMVMEICDQRTQGLDGPTSASRSLREGESANFVNFVRNIGSARDVALGGGTYGFGKSSLFKLSRCKTILIHTRTEENGVSEQRLIGMAMGSAFDHNGLRYTGRHWWGALHDEEGGSVDPLIQDEANDLAGRLGFLQRASDDQRGTSIMILDPVLEDFEQGDGADGPPPGGEVNRLKARIQDTILWHCWPKFTRMKDGSPPMECHLSILGDASELPDPATIQPLWLLTRALATARERQDRVFCLNPKKLVGFFGDCSASIDLPADDRFRIHLGEAALIPSRLHHVALLRPAELVVRYEEGTVNEAERLQWAGVFITDIGENAEVEKAFAMSEPPAHDDWQPKSAQALTPHQRTYVNVALKRIRERIRQLSGAELIRKPTVATGAHKSLASLAGEIGRSLIGGGPGGADGRSRSGSGGGGGGRRRTLRLSLPASVGTTLRDGIPVATFRLRVTGESDVAPSVVITPWVQMDEGGKESTAPNGVSPQVIGVDVDSQSILISGDGSPLVIPLGARSLDVHVTVPDYVAVGITAEILGGEES